MRYARVAVLLVVLLSSTGCGMSQKQTGGVGLLLGLGGVALGVISGDVAGIISSAVEVGSSTVILATDPTIGEGASEPVQPPPADR